MLLVVNGTVFRGSGDGLGDGSERFVLCLFSNNGKFVVRRLFGPVPEQDGEQNGGGNTGYGKSGAAYPFQDNGLAGTRNSPGLGSGGSGGGRSGGEAGGNGLPRAFRHGFRSLTQQLLNLLVKVLISFVLLHTSIFKIRFRLFHRALSVQSPAFSSTARYRLTPASLRFTPVRLDASP